MAGGTGLTALAQWLPTHGDRIKLASGITLALMVLWSPAGLCRSVTRCLPLGLMELCCRARSGAGAMSEGRWRLYKGCIKKRLQLLFHKKKRRRNPPQHRTIFTYQNYVPKMSQNPLKILDLQLLKRCLLIKLSGVRIPDVSCIMENLDLWVFLF